MAEWLDSTFNVFDGKILYAMHSLCQSCGGFFSPFFGFITFLGNGGWAFIVAGVIMLVFKNTRRTGLAMLFALGVGGVLTNVILKNLVGRARPFIASEEYFSFWQFAGSVNVGESSFPSGHATAAMASMLALFLSACKKWSWIGLVFAFVMGITRLYFAVHYPTDVIAGFLCGGLSGVIGFYLSKYLFNLLTKSANGKTSLAILNFDIIESLKKNK